MKIFAILKNGQSVEYGPVLSTFPGGEEHVNVKTELFNSWGVTYVQVVSFIKDSSDMMRTTLVLSALKEWTAIDPALVIPYFPYARQDRVCNEGDAPSLKVAVRILSEFCSIIHCDDIHSDAVFSLPGGSKVFSHRQADILREAVEFPLEDKYIVFPDKGAANKAWQYHDKCKGMFFGEKIRDPKTGALSGFNVDCDDFQGKDLLVVDDICDGGGTFIGLGKILKERNCGNLELYVTHGIFSKGMYCLLDVFDNVYCKNRF